MSNHLYPKLQAAYQQSYNTETAILRIHNDVLKAIDNQNGVIPDLFSACDTVDHDILVTRLQTQFDFTGTVLQ